MRDTLLVIPIAVMTLLLSILTIKNGGAFAFYLVIEALGVAVFGAGTLLGISFFGVGLNETTTTIVFKSLFFGGIWAIITLGVMDLFIGGGVIGIAIYSGFSVMFLVGLFAHIRGGSE